MAVIGIIASINWKAPNTGCEGDYFEKISSIAQHNSDIKFYIADLFSLQENGDICVFDIDANKTKIVSVNEINLFHFMDFEHVATNELKLQDKWKALYDKLDLLEKFNIPCVNKISSIHYCLDKSYLFDLQKNGIPIMETALIESSISISDLKNKYMHGSHVIKALRGECGYHVFKLENISDDDYREFQQQDSHFLLQPMQKEIAKGEISLLFFEDQLCHGFIRKPITDSFPSKKEVVLYAPSEKEIEFGLEVYRQFKVPLGIYRVDFVLTEKGPVLMEVESADPFHYGHLNPQYNRQIGNFYRKQLHL